MSSNFTTSLRNRSSGVFHDHTLKDNQLSLLQDIKNNTANINVNVDSLEVNTDQLETKLDTIINGSHRDINNTHSIGDGSSNHTSVSMGYDRNAGQARSLLVDSDAHLQVDLVSGGDVKSTLDSFSGDVNNTGSIGDGSTQLRTVPLGYDRSGGKARSLLVDSDGRLEIQVLGNEVGDGSGASKHLHLDGTGNVQTNVVNTVNTNPANSSNSIVTNSPTSALAVGLQARTTIATGSTSTNLLCDSDGHLKVDVVGDELTTTQLHSNTTIAGGADNTHSTVINFTSNPRSITILATSASGSVPGSSITIGAMVSMDNSNFFDLAQASDGGTFTMVTKGDTTQEKFLVIKDCRFKHLKVKITNSSGTSTQFNSFVCF